MSGMTSDEARELTDRIKIFAQPQRLMILSLLLDGALAVGEIEIKTGIGQPTLSQQIGMLRRAGVISARRNSRSIYYDFSNEKEKETVRVLLALLRDGNDMLFQNIEKYSVDIEENRKRPIVHVTGEGAFFARVVSKNDG
mgnify:CR=1 FL=1